MKAGMSRFMRDAGRNDHGGKGLGWKAYYAKPHGTASRDRVLRPTISRLAMELVFVHRSGRQVCGMLVPARLRRKTDLMNGEAQQQTKHQGDGLESTLLAATRHSLSGHLLLPSTSTGLFHRRSIAAPVLVDGGIKRRRHQEIVYRLDEHSVSLLLAFAISPGVRRYSRRLR